MGLDREKPENHPWSEEFTIDKEWLGKEGNEYIDFHT